MASYYLELQTPQGVRLGQYSAFYSLQYSRKTNDVGWLKFRLPAGTDMSLFEIDGRILVYRNLRLEMEAVWLIQDIDYVLDSNGQEYYEIWAVGATELLNRRIVAYAAASAEAAKSEAADLMMKNIVYENMHAGATDTDRSIEDWLSIEPGNSAPVVEKRFSRRNLLTVFQEIADMSNENGTRLYFDIVPFKGNFEFRTYTGQRGDDRGSTSAARLIVSPEMGNMSFGFLRQQYSMEQNAIYVGGDGEEELREVVEVEDEIAQALSPYHRREGWKDGRGGTTTAGLTNLGEQVLSEKRPKLIFEGDMQETPQCRYGVDWDWGDRVEAQFGGRSFDCNIEVVNVRVDSNSESITASLRAEVNI